MFLLLLMGLGAAGVKAQVRIGGNTAPSKAAVLDLNATDAANTGTGGLVLPRVNLTSNTMPLTTGVTNVTGTMVYDVTATLGQIGVYYWNGASWVKASLPSTSASDSGLVLMSNGSSLVLADPVIHDSGITLSMSLLPSSASVTWLKIVDASISVSNVPAYSYFRINIPELQVGDYCYITNWIDHYAITYTPYVYVFSASERKIGTNNPNIRCYRPSA